MRKMQAKLNESAQEFGSQGLERLCDEAIVKIWQMPENCFRVVCDRVRITGLLANRNFGDLLAHFLTQIEAAPVPSFTQPTQPTQPV